MPIKPKFRLEGDAEAFWDPSRLDDVRLSESARMLLKEQFIAGARWMFDSGFKDVRAHLSQFTDSGGKKIRRDDLFVVFYGGADVAAEELFGRLSLKELILDDLDDSRHPEDQAAILNGLRAILAAAEAASVEGKRK